MIRPGALLLMGGLAASLAAGRAPAATPPAAAAGAPTRAQLEAGAFHLKVLMGALQSKEVAEPIKNVLFVCLYENAFQKISDATSKVIAGNKLDPKDPNKVLTVMAGICGLRPGEEGAPAGKPTPPTVPKAGPQEPPTGR